MACTEPGGRSEQEQHLLLLQPIFTHPTPRPGFCESSIELQHGLHETQSHCHCHLVLLCAVTNHDPGERFLRTGKHARRKWIFLI